MPYRAVYYGTTFMNERSRPSYLGFGITVILLVLVLLPAGSVMAKTDLLQSEQEWLNEHSGEIFFAPEKDYPPFIWQQYDTIFGISKDYINLIQENLEVSFKEREARPLNEILDALKNNEVSIVSSVTETAERSEYLLFTRPYFTTPAVYVGKSGTRSVSANEILEDKLKVSVGDGYGVHEFLKKRYPEMIFVTEPNDYLVLQDLIEGTSDVAVLDAASLSYLISENKLKN